MYIVCLFSQPAQGDTDKEYNLDILVENLGHANSLSSRPKIPLESRKGILGKVTIDDKQKENWQAYSFEFSQSFIAK